MRAVLSQTLTDYRERCIQRYLRRALHRAQGSPTAAARSLSQHRVNFIVVLDRHRVPHPHRPLPFTQVLVAPMPWTLPVYRAKITKRYLLRALAAANGNATKAAVIAGRNRTNFHSMVARYAIPRRRTNRGAWDRPIPGYDECPAATLTAKAHTSG